MDKQLVDRQIKIKTNKKFVMYRVYVMMINRQTHKVGVGTKVQQVYIYEVVIGINKGCEVG